MFLWAVLCLCLLQMIIHVLAQKECLDLRGRLVSHGAHYVPGPDSCTLCVCDNGVPLECKAVLCSPPQECRSFRLGVTCCEFICLDDVVKPAEAEANVRVAGGGAAAVVLATALLVVYRVRRQKRRRATHADDQRSITSIGYISGSMNYMSGTCEPALGAWKPAAHYMPRGEAPPPYDEVVAQCRAENTRLMSEVPFHRTYPAGAELPRADDALCNGHAYVNVQRPPPQMPNPQGCYNAPLLQPVHPDVTLTQMSHYPLAPNMLGVGQRSRLTGSLGAISGRGVGAGGPGGAGLEHERPHNVPGFYPAAHLHAAHRTIPRISTAIEALEAGAFRRAEAAAVCGAAEVRRSFHRPVAARRDTGRSVPRHLDLAADCIDRSTLRLSSDGRSRAHSSDNVGTGEGGVPPTSLPAPLPAPLPTPLPVPLSAPTTTLPLTADKPSCECSYAGTGAGAGAGVGAGAGAGAGGAGPDDADDYRSECENCKSANSSRWVLEEGWGDEEEGGTQTLQRRAPPPPAPAPATATLPQPVTKTRTAMGPPSNWENWFNSIPDSDTESEEE